MDFEDQLRKLKKINQANIRLFPQLGYMLNIETIPVQVLLL